MKNPLDWNIEDLTAPDLSQVEDAGKKELEFDAKLAQVFGTKSGKEVLKWLRSNTIEAATWMAGLGYEKAIAHGFAREGQNALVRNIEDRIERYKNHTNQGSKND